MTNKPILQDPSNRVVAVFDDRNEAKHAIETLSQLEGTDGEPKLFQGEDAADRIDTSAKWFADTDSELRRYEQELRAGNSIVSVPIVDADYREKVHAAMKQHHARLVTHFGDWVTEMMR